MLLTASCFVAVLLGCLGIGVDKEQSCWIDYHTEYAACFDPAVDCFREASTEVENDACIDEFRACRDNNEAATVDCAGEDGCVDVMLDCRDQCEDAVCNDECRDDLELCADWYDRDCEDACWDELSARLDAAEAALEASGYQDTDTYYLELEDATEDAYGDCIPACYEEK